MTDCLYCNISRKLVPAKIIYEDDDILALSKDESKSKIHFVIIPKIHIESMLFLEDKHQLLMGKIMLKANEIAKSLGLDGYKVVIHTGAIGGQINFHLHVHVKSGK